MKMSVADYLSQLTSDQVVTEEVEKTAAQSQQKTVLTTSGIIMFNLICAQSSS